MSKEEKHLGQQVPSKHNFLGIGLHNMENNLQYGIR